LKNQEGISLIILLIMVVFVGIMMVGIQAFLGENMRLSVAESQRARVLYLAEAGMSDSYWELKYSQKLYGLSSQPYGQIDQQTVDFGDGTSGTYSVPAPTDSVVATGAYKGISRRLKVGITNVTTRYSFFAASNNNFTFPRSAYVSGNVYVNGNVTVTTPTNIDTNQMDLYLPSGKSATYSGGVSFPYTTINPAPTLSTLNTVHYDSLLTRAATFPSGNQTWGNTTVPETVWVHGNLTIQANRTISTAGSYSVIVVTGSVSTGQSVNFANNIQIIANSTITLGTSNGVGTTTGLSGNLLFIKTSQISIGQTNTINGSIVSNNNLVILSSAVLNGFIYVKNNSDIRGTVTSAVTINGCIWGNSYTSNTMGKGVRINWNSGYIPSTLPPGVSSIDTRVFSLVSNSWKEL
jgi:acetyltransferase-like isoleucine patch superfamily enzyme